MNTPKLIKDEDGQKILLPEEFYIDDDEIYIKRDGDAIMIYPKAKALEIFMSGLEDLGEDFMAEGREQGFQAEREQL